MTTKVKAPRVARTGAAVAEAALRRLAAVKPGAHRVVSCYLKIEPRDRARGKYLIKVRNRIREMEQALPGLGLPRDVADAVAADLGRVLDFLKTPGNLPAAHGIAIFACRPARLFEVVPLPSVHRSRVAIDRTPLVRELAGTLEEFGRIYTAVVDRTAARLFEVTAGSATEVAGLTGMGTRGGRFRGDQDGPGWGEYNYHNRIREEKQRHYEAVSRALAALDRAAPARGVVLAGMGPDAGAVTPFLPVGLRERLFGTLKLSPREATPATVHARTLELRADYKRREERALVAEVEAREGEGWAVNGIHATLKALGRGQVRTLLVQADASETGCRCGDSGRLVLEPRECRGEGEPTPVVDVIDDAIEDALRQGVDVNVVYEDDSAASIDGLAALLRFR